jgi:hypothetical protein
MRTLTLLAAVALCATSFSQVPDLNPPAELKKLDWIVGGWSGQADFNFGGMEMSVKTKMTVSYDGQFLKSVVLNDYGMLQVTETMYLGWDGTKGEYVSWAFTNLSPLPRVERGKLDGDKLVMVSEPWGVMGQDMVSRATIAKTSDTKAMFTLELKAGEGWEKATDMEMTKDSAGGL